MQDTRQRRVNVGSAESVPWTDQIGFAVGWYRRPVKSRSIAATIVATTVGFTFPSTQEVAAQVPALRVLASNGVKAGIEELQ